MFLKSVCGVFQVSGEIQRQWMKLKEIIHGLKLLEIAIICVGIALCTYGFYSCVKKW